MIADIAFDKANDLAHALQLLSEQGPAPTLLAGGTDVMVWIQSGQFTPKRIIDIWRIRPECAEIVEEPDSVSIGALATYSEIIESEAVNRCFPALVEACREVGATQIQNRGTMGGNIGGSSPAGDTLPLLLAYNADIVMKSLRGTRTVPYQSFCTGYRSTVMEKDELIAAVSFPKPSKGSFHFWRKVGTRSAQSISKVMIAGLGRLDDDRRVKELRLGVGSVAPIPILMTSVAELLTGHQLNDEMLEKARAVSTSDISPIDDVRSTARYRSAVTGNLVVRFLKDLAEWEG